MINNWVGTVEAYKARTARLDPEDFEATAYTTRSATTVPCAVTTSQVPSRRGLVSSTGQ